MQLAQPTLEQLLYIFLKTHHTCGQGMQRGSGRPIYNDQNKVAQGKAPIGSCLCIVWDYFTYRPLTVYEGLTPGAPRVSGSGHTLEEDALSEKRLPSVSLASP